VSQVQLQARPRDLAGCMTQAHESPMSASFSRPSVRCPLSMATDAVSQAPNPVSAFAYRRVAHDTSFYEPCLRSPSIAAANCACLWRDASLVTGDDVTSFPARSHGAAGTGCSCAARGYRSRQWGRNRHHSSRQILPRARLSLPSLPPVLMAGGAFIQGAP
jgi:hypothetical protein